MPSKLTEARREYMRVWWRKKYYGNPEFRAAQNANNARNELRYDAERRRPIEEFKKDGCYLCDEKEPICIAAHHLRDKEFNIGDGLRKKFSAPKIQAELLKCIPLCQNCHHKVHAGLITILVSNGGGSG